MDKTSIELVFFHELNLLSIFSVLLLPRKSGPVKVFYYRETRWGSQMAKCFTLLRIFQAKPKKIRNPLLIDTPHCKIFRNFAQLAIVSKKNSHKIRKVIEPLFKGETSDFIDLLTLNIRKSWELSLSELMNVCNVASLETSRTGLPMKNVAIFSSFTNLAEQWEIKTGVPSNNLRKSFEAKNILRHLGSMLLVFQGFFEWISAIIQPPKKPQAQTEQFRFGTGAAWGVEGNQNGRLDDLFWWRNANISGSRVVYLYDRVDVQPRFSIVKKIKSLGIQSVALNPQRVGDYPELYCGKRKREFFQLIRDLNLVIFLAVKNFCNKDFQRQILSQLSWYITRSTNLAPSYKHLNLKGIFHHHEVGIDLISLAARFAGGVRIGTHWSSFNGICEVNRSHDVFFIWGLHDAKIIIDSGSVSKHLLIVGSIATESYKRTAFEKAEKATIKMKKDGVRYIISLFDSSVESPEFFGFFLRWLIDDPALGLLIKCKDGNWVERTGENQDSLSDKAIKTGRIYSLDSDASPADAARISDFSVGIGSISAVVVAALKGARVFFLDYERLDESSQKPYCTLHSLGPNRCVFYNPESLKRAVLEYIDNPETNPYLGDASPILEKLDPFRDGKASIRIGNYISWYLEGIDQGWAPLKALEMATRKYSDQWGREYVIKGIDH